MLTSANAREIESLILNHLLHVMVFVFVACEQVLGESEQKTSAILEASAGCVLVIDEAYGLNPGKNNDPYRVRIKLLC